MSGFGDSKLLVWDPFPNPDVENHIPILTELQQRQLAKAALKNVPGGQTAFNRAFGGGYKQDPHGQISIPDTGMPWTLGSQARG